MGVGVGGFCMHIMSEKYYTYLIGSKPIGGNLLNFT